MLLLLCDVLNYSQHAERGQPSVELHFLISDLKAASDHSQTSPLIACQQCGSTLFLMHQYSGLKYHLWLLNQLHQQVECTLHSYMYLHQSLVYRHFSHVCTLQLLSSFITLKALLYFLFESRLLLLIVCLQLIPHFLSQHGCGHVLKDSGTYICWREKIAPLCSTHKICRADPCMSCWHPILPLYCSTPTSSSGRVVWKMIKAHARTFTVAIGTPNCITAIDYCSKVYYMHCTCKPQMF